MKPKREKIRNNEHGSWAIFLIPVACAFLAASTVTAAALLLFAGSLMVFLAYKPAEVFIQESLAGRTSSRRATARLYMLLYGLPGVAVSVIALVTAAEVYLWGIAVLAFLLFAANQLVLFRLGKTLARDLSGMLALTLGAPAFWLALGKPVNQVFYLLWASNILFFTAGSLYVYASMANLSKTGTGAATARQAILFYVLLVVSAVMLFMADAAYWFILPAFLPLLCHTMYRSITRTYERSFKTLGITLLAYSLIFAFFLGFFS